MATSYSYYMLTILIKQKMPTSSLRIKWVLLYTRAIFIPKESLFHKRYFHAWQKPIGLDARAASMHFQYRYYKSYFNKICRFKG